MGGFYGSIHFRTEAADRVISALRPVFRELDLSAFVAPSLRGWVSVYPQMESMDDLGWVGDVQKSIGAEHAIAFVVHDSDVLMYWYFRHGQFADIFVSEPEYFGDGEAPPEETAGKPENFAGLLDAQGQRKLKALLARPQLEDDEADPPFEFEEERLAAIGSVLGIAGAVGIYDDLDEGEEVEGAGSAEMMKRVP